MRNTLSMENGERKYVIDLRTPSVSAELASSSDPNLEGEMTNVDEGKHRIERNDKSILELEGYSEDDGDSMIGLFHWQMDEYGSFNCNMLQIEEPEEDLFLEEYGESKEGEARVNETSAHQFDKEKHIQYEEPTLKVTNLGDKANHKNI